MPELPEVETVVRELRPRLEGRRMIRLARSKFAMRQAWRPGWARKVQGQGVERIWRRGKWIILDLAGGQHFVIHLGMTGQLTVRPAGDPLQPHTHLIATLDGGKQQLRFRDVRRFGSLQLFANAGALEHFFADSELGPEPFSLDADYWREQLAGTNRCLKAVLLDQRVVAGVGNIYADESLHLARLHPAQSGRATDRRQARRLRDAIVTVLNQAIARRGATIKDFVGGSGKQGEYQNEFRVYGQTGKPCPTCKTPILRIRLAGRSTHFCPRCQRERNEK